MYVSMWSPTVTDHVHRVAVALGDTSVGKVKHGVLFVIGSEDEQRGQHGDDGGRKANPGST